MRYTHKRPSVLALETSCDESAVAVIRLESGKIRVMASVVASQIEEHSKWGGVVPEIASRRHVEALPFLIEQAVTESGMLIENVDAIAATVAPGLAGSLMVGSVTARTLASLHSLPFLGVHHLEGHLASVRLGNAPPAPPYLVLLVSGGHTELIRVSSYWEIECLGRSHDDAVGEAFDKVARLLGLSYPGGPAIEKVAEGGDFARFALPKGRISIPGGGFHPYHFSFSGLKTAMLRKVEAIKDSGKNVPVNDLAASFEHVVAEVLVERSLKCAKDHDLSRLVMVGGVAANNRLRTYMAKRGSEQNIQVFCAPKAFCTDNAAMIGAAAITRLELGNASSSFELGVSPRWPLEDSSKLYCSNPPF